MSLQKNRKLFYYRKNWRIFLSSGRFDDVFKSTVYLSGLRFEIVRAEQKAYYFVVLSATFVAISLTLWSHLNVLLFTLLYYQPRPVAVLLFLP